MAREQFKDIDEYIDSFPKNIGRILERMRQTIQKSAPEAKETMSYGIPTFDLEGKHLVHFAAFKYHVSFYPTPSGIEKFKKEISLYKWAKGSIQFPIDNVPFALIKDIVVFRVEETLKKNN